MLHMAVYNFVVLWRDFWRKVTAIWQI